MIKRVSADQVPKEYIDKLGVLKRDIVEYVLIGDSYYEVRPFSVIKITTILNEIVSIINSYRKEKSDVASLTGIDTGIRSENQVNDVSIYDIFGDEELRERLIGLMHKMLDGVDKVDLDSMNIAQFNSLLNTLWNVNINSFPDEKTRGEFLAKVVGIMMMINPSLYRYFVNTQFIDDINKILERRSDLREEIDKELRQMYAGNVAEAESPKRRGRPPKKDALN